MIIIFPRNVSFREYYVFVSNAAAAAAPPPPPPRHNFVVSAITFEGFKLRSSNLTHALFIQISRTSSITDIVVQSKMAAGGHFVNKISTTKKLRIDLKWQELWSKVIFGHPNGRRKKILYRSEMARIAIESEFSKSKMANRSEMARNTIESEFRTSKMTDGSHFVKKIQKKLKLRIDLKWPEYEWFEQCSNRLLADYNLVSIYIHTDSYVGYEGIYIVFAL